MRGIKVADCLQVFGDQGIEAQLLNAAGSVKRLAVQIHVIIHALGILLCLPHILKPDERIEYVSLGAGNTGKAFDVVAGGFRLLGWT
jgi:hypothetical protein